jgi:hypothetical protein
MKPILLFFSLLVNFFYGPGTFTGVLKYEVRFTNELHTGTIYTTIYENGDHARVESVSVEDKNGTPDPATAKPQNVLIYDFSANKTTHLVAKQNMATIMSTNPDPAEQMMSKMGTTVQIENLGPEKIGNYSCIHYAMRTVNPSMKANNDSKKEFWISNDLGSSGIQYVSAYLYYFKGGFMAKKLSEAGATGVVVRWKISDIVCNLVSAGTKQPDASSFAIPSGYTTRDVGSMFK